MLYKSRIIAVVASMLVCGCTVAFAGSIDVLEARYGTLGSGRSCDATANVAAVCNGMARCSVDVGNGSLCGDPDFLVVKKIMIKYKCGRKSLPVSILGNEYSNYDLSCG